MKKYLMLIALVSLSQWGCEFLGGADDLSLIELETND